MSVGLTQQVKNFIQSHHLIQRGEHVLVAVSGGADSVALLYILRELTVRLRLRLTVAHLNHKIRGPDANEDAACVKKLARRLRLDFVGQSVNVPRLAGRRGISLEMAGRRARYGFFEKTALARNCDVVATAHTADDNAETILLMLARGCGLQGLTGIAPDCQIGNIKVIRPLLGTDRKVIEHYLRERNITWREDASNADPGFMRNRVRHELLPLLETKFNKGIKHVLIRLADVLRSENELLNALATAIYAKARAGNDRVLNCALIAGYHPAARRRILRHWLLTNGIFAGELDFQTINTIDDLLSCKNGCRSAEIGGGIIIQRRNQFLKIENHKADSIHPYRLRLAIPGETPLPEAGLIVTANIGMGYWRERAVFGKFPARAALSLKVWRRRAILVRTWQAGDRIHPHGLDGSKKIQDIFCNAKVSPALRHQLPIFECGGEIVWIPGYRIAGGWEVQGASDAALHLTVNRL